MTDMTPTLPPLGPLPLPNIRGSGIPNLFTSEAMQSYATAYGEQCAREAVAGASAPQLLVETEQGMVDMVPPATARDRWMYEQGRLAERAPRTPPAVEARVPDGWVLVPKEPTPEMCAAAQEEKEHDFRRGAVTVSSNIYRAMLSAAPAAPQEPQRVTEAMIHKVEQAIWTASSGDFEPTKDEIRTICNAVLDAPKAPHPLLGELIAQHEGLAEELRATQPPTQQANDDLIFQCGKAAGRQEVKDAQAQPGFRSWIQQAYRDPETTQFTIHNMEVAYQAGREAAPQQASAQGEQAQQASAQPTQAAKSLNAKIADQLRPFLKPGDKVIWRDSFRWMDDDGVLSNHYDSMDLPQLADDFGYEVDWDTNMHHAAIVRASNTGQEKSS